MSAYAYAARLNNPVYNPNSSLNTKPHGPHNCKIGNYFYDSFEFPRYDPPPQRYTYVAPPTNVPLPSMAETSGIASEIWYSRKSREQCYGCMFEWRPGRAICCVSTVFFCCTSALVVSVCASASFYTQYASTGIAAAAATACWTLICGYQELRNSDCCPQCCDGYQQV